MNISFEFFPPQTTTAKKNLDNAVNQLAAIKPSYYSVTFGARGAVQNKTISTVAHLIDNCNTPIVPHLSCINSKPANILILLKKYKKLNIKNLITIRGDIPSDMSYIGDFQHTHDLIKFIRDHFANNFQLTVAAYPEKHPQAKSYSEDLKYLLAKLELADNAITQYFYNIDAFLYLRDDVAKYSHKEIIPGIMPINNIDNLVRFSKMCNAQIPQWLINRLQDCKNDIDCAKFSYDVVNNLCQKLKNNGVNSFHFYTMNKAHPSLEIAHNLL